MLNKKESTIPYVPFSEKYIKYYWRAKESKMNVLEGAMGSGKTLINVMSFAEKLETHKDKLFLVSGSSATNAKTVVADCNGFGLEHLFRGRCRWVKLRGGAEALRINTETGTKDVMFIGGGDKGSFKKIQGMRFGMWLATEIINHYVGYEPRYDFISMAFSRLTNSTDERVYWDLNPVYPTHEVYVKYLDPIVEQGNAGTYAGGVNYSKVNIYANSSITDEQLASILSKYVKGSVEYKRNVLGLREVAEGLIFGQFADNSKKWIVNLDFLKGRRVDYVTIGVDFGGNKSHTGFVATAICDNFQTLVVIADDALEMVKGSTDTNTIRTKFKEFYNKVIALGLGRVQAIYGDCAEQVLLTELQNAMRELGVFDIPVMDSYKGSIKSRIDCKQILLNTDRWFVLDTCKLVITSTQQQVWNTKEGHEDERLDNGEDINIDIADSEEYSWSKFIPQLTYPR